MSAETVGISTSPGIGSSSPGMGVETTSGPPGSITSEAPNFSSSPFISPESTTTLSQTDIFNSTRPFQVSPSDFIIEGPIRPSDAQVSIPIEFTPADVSFSPKGLEATEFPLLEMAPLNAPELSQFSPEAPVYNPREVEEYVLVEDLAGLAGDTSRDGLVSPSEEVLTRADTYPREERIQVPEAISWSLSETNLDPDQSKQDSNLTETESPAKLDVLAIYLIQIPDQVITEISSGEMELTPQSSENLVKDGEIVNLGSPITLQQGTNLPEADSLNLHNSINNQVETPVARLEAIAEGLDQRPATRPDSESEMIKDIKQSMAEQATSIAIRVIEETAPEEFGRIIQSLSEIAEDNSQVKDEVTEVLAKAESELKSAVQVMKAAVESETPVKADRLPLATSELEALIKLEPAQTLPDLVATEKQLGLTIKAFTAAGIDPAIARQAINESLQSLGVRLVENGLILSPQTEQQVIAAVSAEVHSIVSAKEQQRLEQAVIDEQDTEVRVAPLTRRNLTLEIIRERERLKMVKDKSAYQARLKAMEQALDRAWELANRPTEAEGQIPVDGKLVLSFIPNLEPTGESAIAKYNDGSLPPFLMAIEEIGTISDLSDGRWKLGQALERNRPVTVARNGEDVTETEVKKVLQGRRGVDIEGSISWQPVPVVQPHKVVTIPQRTLFYSV